MSARAMPPSAYNLLELYRQHRDEIDAVTDQTCLFLLAFTNEIKSAQIDALAADLNLSLTVLRSKLSPLLRGQLMLDDRGTLTVTSSGRRILAELGFIPPPIAPGGPKQPDPSPTHPKPETLPEITIAHSSTTAGTPGWLWGGIAFLGTGILVLAAILIGGMAVLSGGLSRSPESTVPVIVTSIPLLTVMLSPSPTASPTLIPTPTASSTPTTTPTASSTPTATPTRVSTPSTATPAPGVFLPSGPPTLVRTSALLPFSNETNVAPTKSGEVQGDCPNGYQVMGGGYIANRESFKVYQSAKQGNGWRVAALNDTDSGGAQGLVVRTICGQNLPGTVSQMTNSVQIAGSNISLKSPPQAGNATIACPSGTVLLGGGFSSSSSLPVSYNGPLGSTTWEVIATNHSTAQQTLTAYAMCYDGAGSSSSYVHQLIPGGDKVSCPFGTFATGGGFQVDPSYEITNSSPVFDLTGPIAWFAFGFIPNAPNNKVDVYAICTKL